MDPHSKLREKIAASEKGLAALTQAPHSTDVVQELRRWVDVAAEERYLDGLRDALRLLTTTDPARTLIDVTAHPAQWATLLRLAANGAVADEDTIGWGLNAGSMTPSEAAAWRAEISLATEPVVHAVTVACQTQPRWRRWFPDDLLTTTAAVGAAAG